MASQTIATNLYGLGTGGTILGSNQSDSKTNSGSGLVVPNGPPPPPPSVLRQSAISSQENLEQRTKPKYPEAPEGLEISGAQHNFPNHKINPDDNGHIFTKSLHQNHGPDSSPSSLKFEHRRSPHRPQEIHRSLESLDKIIGLRDVCGNSELWRMLLAEFIGTLFLVLVGCGSCLSGWTDKYEPSVVQIALAFGITVATMAQAIGHVSGCHINPAVTIGLLASGNCSFLKSIFYIVAQCLGGISGSAILQVITPTEIRGNLGMTFINPKVTPVQGMFVEALITSVLVLTVCGVCDSLRKDIKGSAPLAIGLSISVCHLMALQYTGSSMNPARTLGPAVIGGHWENNWVYWAGPIIGGFTAGFLYHIGFQEVNREMDECTPSEKSFKTSRSKAFVA